MHSAREALAVIIRFAGQVQRRRSPLMSNVRTRREHEHMKRLLVQQAVFGGLFLAIAIGWGWGVLYFEGRVKDSSAELIRSIETTQDIEKLRLAALMQAKNQIQTAAVIPKLMHLASRAVLVSALCGAAMFGVNFLSVLKRWREQEGRPTPWLKGF